MNNICNLEENFSPKELTPAPYFQFFKHFNPKVKMTDKLRKKLRKQYKKLIKDMKKLALQFQVYFLLQQ